MNVSLSEGQSISKSNMLIATSSELPTHSNALIVTRS